jgi:hypothetical protein
MSYYAEGDLVAGVHAAQFPSHGGTVYINRISVIPNIIDWDSVSSFSIFILHGEDAVCTFLQKLESSLFVQ